MRGRITMVWLGGAAIAAAAFVVFVPQWVRPPVGATEIGISPTSMIQFARGHLPEPVSQVAPAPLPPVATGGPAAAATYKNVQVLTDLSAAEFMRLQHAMTAWVAPQQGCAFCHTGQDYAADAKPEKQAARLMLRMVRHINADWKNHVGAAGVTCYTCHRGQPVPADMWFPLPPRPDQPFIAKQENWNEGADTVGKFFPDDSYAEYLLEETPISVQSATALPGNTVAAQIVAKRVYEMMMQMSDGIGVNCGYCHNSRAFESWAQSTPARWTAYDGIHLTRDLNRNFLLHLPAIVPQTRQRTDATDLPVLPARDTGRQLGNGLVLCATCHYGEPKPLGGALMLQDYPGLTAPSHG